MTKEKRPKWIVNALSGRGGKYAVTESAKGFELREISARLQAAAKRLHATALKCEQSPTGVEVVGLQSLRDALSSCERHVGLLTDCVDQWEALTEEFGDYGDIEEDASS